MYFRWMTTLCETRWNTILAVLKSVIEQYEKVLELLTIEQRHKWYINIELAEELIRFLVPFKEATESLEGQTYPTACKVLLWWENLSTHLNTDNFNSFPIKQLARVAKTFFDSKFKISVSDKIACFLDPRYRFLKMLPEEDRTEVYNEVKKLLEELPQIHSGEPVSKKTRFSAFEETSVERQAYDELEFYMQNANYSEYVSTEEEKRHLVESFWRNNKEKLPKLYLMATKRLHVPASSSPSEIVFSTAGRTYSNRVNLKPENLNNLLFLKNNLEFQNEK